ncbi:hypothetical protein [Subtercola frigoramans]|uniref:Glycosyltransferase RgtA/B/C/D-like domain-containing protein n=1 Tax=Subtercola frigoramans TaxID=120298 RepID=A0ABS2L3X9_9MICO|nr:hypothetical protein [Subtercola frigoramans]MBM7471753.1 hypothetical protein [Subtercola frigoramans]
MGSADTGNAGTGGAGRGGAGTGGVGADGAGRGGVGRVGTLPQAAQGPGLAASAGETSASGASIHSATESRAGWRSPWWLSVIGIYLAARAVTTVMLLVLASVQGKNPWTGAQPSYWDYASIWDGTWYKIIAYWPYPSQLPLTTSGHVSENAWAFLPGYPYVVRGLSTLTTAPWEYVSVAVSFAFGLGAALVFYKLMRLTMPHGTALFATVLLCIAPVSPMFQVAYAESMALFLLMLALWFLIKRNYWMLFPIVFVMALTRPSGLAFALCLALYFGYRWWMRAKEPFGTKERVLVGAATVFSAFMGFAWTLVAWAGTGYFSAYTDTELAWRASYIGYTKLIPFTAWFQGGNWWLGAPAGAIVVVLLAVAFALVMATKAVRRIDLTLRLWVIAYAVYLFAVFFPQSSTFRLLMPLFPLLGVMALPKSRVYRVALVIVFLAAQWGWLLICWGVDGSDWSPP